jgi:dihydropteroate synthase
MTPRAGRIFLVSLPLEQRFPRPSVMGVVNVTPDSFSDGGVHLDAEVAVEAARRMIDEGAAIVDVGGESTRPGSESVDVDTELRRVVPVLEALQGVPVSIDTAKAEVARRAVELGAELVNDVTALRGDPELAGVVADSGAFLCLMHMRGDPRTMQVDPTYGDVASEVASFLEQRLALAVAAGVPEERVCLDPGIGFGKTVEQNFELLRRLDVLLALGRPVLIGFSRKSSLGRILGDAAATTGPLSASVGAAVAAFERGATILRVHDVREHVEALTVAAAVRGPAQAMIVELAGLRIFGKHGVYPEEKKHGQDFLYDVELEVGERGATDRLEEAVDYEEVARCVQSVSDAKSYDLLEALASAVADELLRRFEPARVAVRVRKPGVRPGGLEVDYSAVTVLRTS